MYYIDTNNNLNELFKKNWIKITETSIMIWEKELEPTWDNIRYSFSAWEDWSVMFGSYSKWDDLYQEWDGWSKQRDINEYIIKDWEMREAKVKLTSK
jgi:hypothetical protein